MTCCNAAISSTRLSARKGLLPAPGKGQYTVQTFHPTPFPTDCRHLFQSTRTCATLFSAGILGTVTMDQIPGALSSRRIAPLFLILIGSPWVSTSGGPGRLLREGALFLTRRPGHRRPAARGTPRAPHHSPTRAGTRTAPLAPGPARLSGLLGSLGLSQVPRGSLPADRS